MGMFGDLDKLDKEQHAESVREQQTASEQPQQTPAAPPLPTRAPSPPITPKPPRKITKHGKKQTPITPHDTTIPRNRDTTGDTTVSRYHDTIIETTRRAVKQLGKEAATHRFTVEEKRALKSVERDYEDKNIRTSENEITRISINYMLEDYKVNGKKSILAQILEILYS
jgi:hypothetical protein